MRQEVMPSVNGLQWRENEKGGDSEMGTGESRRGGYILAALIGAIGGGAAVAVATKAIPKMMSQMMSGMMQNMMARMGEGGCLPDT